MPAEVQETARQLRLAVGHLVRRLKVETAGAEGLPSPQVATLGWLDRDGPLTTSQLAAAQLVRHQSAARAVSLLAAQRLVRLRPHPTDARKQLVSITASGRRALVRQRDRRAEWLAELIAAELTQPEQRTLAKAAQLLLRLAEG